MRIIAGKFRGKKLSEFNLNNIRPTSDIVKEAIFNTLQNEIYNSEFLDLFGGTGSVGLEAVSRGAKNVVICDSNINSINLIKKNNALLNNLATVLHLSYDKAIIKLSQEGYCFDIIFLDPPYNSDFGIKAIELIYKHNLLKPDGLIVFEHHKNSNFNFPSYCKIYNEKQYGIKKVIYIELEDENGKGN